MAKYSTESFSIRRAPIDIRGKFIDQGLFSIFITARERTTEDMPEPIAFDMLAFMQGLVKQIETQSEKHITASKIHFDPNQQPLTLQLTNITSHSVEVVNKNNVLLEKKIPIILTL